MRSNRNAPVYALLILGWLAVSVWQIAEHRRVRDAAAKALLTRASDISTSLSVVIRSQGRFGIVPRPRLEAALDELAKTSEILSVGLLDLYGNPVVSAGEHVDFELPQLADGRPIWGPHTLMVANVVELGPRVEAEATTTTRRLIRGPDLGPRVEDDRTTGTRRQGRGGPDREMRGERSLGPPPDDQTRFRDEFSTATHRGEPGSFAGQNRNRERPPEGRAPGEGPGRERMRPPGDHPPGEGPGGPPPDRDGVRMRFARGRPPWINEAQFAQLMRLEGPYYLALLLNRGASRAIADRDLWLRMALIAIGLVATLGLGAAWRGATRSLDLEVRLARAQEMNTVLREMNLAAAGLAHETRNPLNIVRGLAQLISKSAPDATDTRTKAQSIVDEVDRVASRLNEFIDYSKPRETKIASTNLRALIAEVGEALETDRDDKQIQFSIEGPDVSIGADEPLLRQAVFNLLLNAFQAVGVGGQVAAAIVERSPREAWLEIRDNGPGVPPEAREEIFRPYFTTREDGAGLGLAVVRQIVLAHHWEIVYLVNDQGQPTFRITGMRIV